MKIIKRIKNYIINLLKNKQNNIILEPRPSDEQMAEGYEDVKNYIMKL